MPNTSTKPKPAGAAALDVPPGGTLTAVLCERLREEILNGRRQPGAKLRLEDLRTDYGVSLSPLREALSRLAAERFVINEEQRGFTVAPVSSDDLEEVMRLRIALETMALQEAIERGDDAWEAGIVAAAHRLAKLEADRRRARDLSEWEHWHREFHMSLLAGCGSPVLLQFCRTLLNLNDRYRRIFLAKRQFDRDVPGEHAAIMQAALARRPREAVHLLEEHIRRTGKGVLSVLGGKARQPVTPPRRGPGRRA